MGFVTEFFFRYMFFVFFVGFIYKANSCQFYGMSNLYFRLSDVEHGDLPLDVFVPISKPSFYIYRFLQLAMSDYRRL